MHAGCYDHCKQKLLVEYVSDTDTYITLEITYWIDRSHVGFQNLKSLLVDTAAAFKSHLDHMQGSL